MIAAGSKAVRPADHQETRTHVVNSVANGLKLDCTELVMRHVAENDRIVGGQRDHIVRQLGCVHDLNRAFPITDRLFQQFPVAFVTQTIRDEQHLSFPFDEDVVQDGVVLVQAVATFVHFDGGGVLVIPGRSELERHREPVLSGLEVDFLLGNHVVVFAQHQFPFAVGNRRQDHGGFVCFTQLDLLGQVESFQPDFVFVRVVDRLDVDGNSASLEIGKSARQIPLGLHTIADQHDAPLHILLDHSGGHRERLFQVRRPVVNL